MAHLMCHQQVDTCPFCTTISPSQLNALLPTFTTEMLTNYATQYALPIPLVLSSTPLASAYRATTAATRVSILARVDAAAVTH
jgi:hypothetical protein